MKPIITKAMRICAEKVRETRCCKCSHFEECVNNGAPVSMFGRYLAQLNMSVLPVVQRRLNEITVHRVKLEASAPFENESGYAVIRIFACYRNAIKLWAKFAVEGNESEDDIYALAVMNYVLASKAKIKKGD